MMARRAGGFSRSLLTVSGVRCEKEKSISGDRDPMRNVRHRNCRLVIRRPMNPRETRRWEIRHLMVHRRDIPRSVRYARAEQMERNKQGQNRFCLAASPRAAAC